MQRNPTKQTGKRKTPEQIVAILAAKYRKSDRYIQMVISGDRTNNDILEDYLFYKQEHNLLLKSVLETVPFNN